MNVLVAAAILPSIFWTGGADTAPLLREAHIEQISVSATAAAAWQGMPGISVQVANPQDAVKLLPPSVSYHYDEAAASSTPWLNTNGWRLLRNPGAHFYYDIPGPGAALAAAEAFAYGGRALIHTDAAGLESLGRMLEFLKTLPALDLPVMANIGYIDDGSPGSGELMNLLVRRNLLFRLETAPDPHLDLNVRYGAGAYAKPANGDPSWLAQKVRSDLSDDKRLVRVFGSEVVIARLTGSGDRVRVNLLNYAATARRVQEIRVSVKGRYPKHSVAVAGIPDAALADYKVGKDSTEFTLPALKEFAVVDLSR